MTLREFADLVKRMRNKQKEFFGGHKTPQTVGEAKDLERRVDRAIEDIERGPGLWDAPTPADAADGEG